MISNIKISDILNYILKQKTILNCKMFHKITVFLLK